MIEYYKSKIIKNKFFAVEKSANKYKTVCVELSKYGTSIDTRKCDFVGFVSLEVITKTEFKEQLNKAISKINKNSF
jgi:hypothetical protein